MTTTSLFQFELVSPERLVFSEQVRSVNVPGSEGDFTALAGHARLISALHPGFVKITKADGTHQRIYLSGGFADVSAEKLIILTEEAIPYESLNLERILQSIQNCREDSADAEDDVTRTKAELRLSYLQNIESALKKVVGT
jgi:F-type H+-transporting ATPase subunit epsilon